MVDQLLSAPALSAIEGAITALGRGDADGARLAIGGLDSLVVQPTEASVHGRIADGVYLVAARIDDDGEVDDPAWDHLADCVGDGHLRAVVEAARG